VTKEKKIAELFTHHPCQKNTVRVPGTKTKHFPLKKVTVLQNVLGAHSTVVKAEDQRSRGLGFGFATLTGHVRKPEATQQ
jgi:hypothetical protein